MPITHSIRYQFSQGNDTLTGSKSYTDDAAISQSFSVAGGTTNALVALALDVSQAKSIYLQATGGALTLKTNSSSTPDATVALPDGLPVVWTTDSGTTNPFGSTDITALYVTNATANAVALEMRILFDPTV
jgi:hypothetical protein